MRMAHYLRRGIAAMALPVLLLCTFALHAQQSPSPFRINYDISVLDLPGGLVPSATGNPVFAGTNTNFFPISGTLTEVDTAGFIQWSRRYNALSLATNFNDLKRVTAGGYVVTGSNGSNLMIMRMDALGNVTWAQTYNVTGGTSSGNRILETSDGGFVVAGSISRVDPDGAGALVRQDSTNMFCVKVNSAGTLEWGNVFFTTTAFQNNHFFTDVAEVSDGYIFVGSVSESAGEDAPTDAIALKTNLTGTRQWTFRFPTSSQGAEAVKRLNATNVLIVGADGTGMSYVQMTAAGAITTGNRYAQGGFSINEAFGTELFFTNDGQYGLLGNYLNISIFPPSFSLSTALLKINPTNGAITFQRSYPPPPNTLPASLLPKGYQGVADSAYYIITMGTGDLTGGNAFDYELIKTNKNGQLNNVVCPEGSISLSRSSYNPALVSFTPLVVSSLVSSPITVVITTPSTDRYITCKVCIPPAAATNVTATNNNFCAGASTTINASGPTPGSTYAVYTQSSGGTTLGNTPRLVSPATTTTYYVETFETDYSSCRSTTRTPITITVFPGAPLQPGAITGATPTCLGSQGYSISAVANATSYTWSVSGGGAITGSGTSININWTTPGTYTVSVTATNTCGTSTARTLSVVVDPPAPAQPGAITGLINPCPGTEGYSIAAVTNATSYNWSISGGGTITGSGTTASVVWSTSGGPYTISVTATNSCGTSTARTLTVNVQPGPPTTIGAINGQTNVCLGSQPYSVPTVAGATTYTWSVSGGGSITGQGNANISINWSTAGTHTISVTASNGCGNVSATPITVTVLGAAPATPGAITGSTTACSTLGNQTYTISPVANAASYTWSISGGGTPVSGANSTSFTVNWTAAGTHTVSVTATNACGTSSPATTQVTVSTTVPPVPGPITGQTTACAGAQAYSVGAVAGATGYTWSVSGGGTITTGQGTSNVTVTWATPGGPYTVSVIPTNVCGNGTSSDLQVTVLAGTILPPANIVGPDPVCISTQSYTAATVAGASSYTWSVSGGGAIASGQGTATAGINWTTAGTWTVSVTANNICGSSTPTTLSVQVLPANPPVPGAIAGTSPACPGTEAYSITAVSGASSYTWSISSGGSISAGQGTTGVDIDWTTAGTWTISVTASNICGASAASTRTVTVLPANPGNAGTIVGTTSACPGSENYSITTLPAATNYAWTVTGGGTITAGQGTAGITIDWTAAGGPYTISVVPSNQCGNGGAATLSVTVLPLNPPAPASITGNTPVCNGTESYTADAVPGATGYTWSVSGGGTIATGQGTATAGINWTTQGTWTVSVTAQNQCGSSTATTLTVVVLPANPATPGNISGTTAVCPGTETFSIPAVPATSGYTWTVGVGGTIVSGQGTTSIDVDWASVSGTYTVAVTADNQCGSSPQSSIQVTVTPGPPTGTPAIVGSATPCPGAQTYTISGVTGATSYAWTLTGGGTIQTGQGTASITVDWTTTGGPYTLEVTPSNLCGNGTVATLDVTVDGPPVIGAATITGDDTPCPGSQSYTVSTVPNSTGYTWTLSGGGTITGGQGTATLTVNWTTAGGPYILSVVANNACGSSSPTTYTVNVEPGPPAIPGAINGPNSICEGEGTGLAYSINAVTDATTYTWSVSSGGAVSGGQGTTSVTIDWTAGPGNYTVSVTAGNACGTSTASTINVTITPGAPAQPSNITGDGNVCPGIENYSVPAVANATGYTWTLSGGGTIATGQGTNAVTVNWTTSGGPYLVSVVATNTCGSSTAQTLNVTVNPSPTAPTIIVTGGDTICEGDDAEITASNSTGGSNITYNIFDSQTGGSLLGVSPLTVAPAVTTTYYVEVINSDGCRYSGGRLPVTVTVSPAPSAPVIQGTDPAVCFNESTTLTATSSNGGNITWWNAATGGTQVGTGNSLVTGNLTSTTTFFAQATSSNGCGSLTGRVPVTVEVAEQPTVLLTSDALNNTIFINQALIATAEPDDYSSYEWFLNGVSVQIDSINTWRSSSLNDGDVISVIATDGSCVGEETELTVVVTDYPNAFTPNGDGRNELFLEGFELVIVNRWGQELYTGKDGWDGTFNGDRVSPGTYFYIVRVPDITDTDKVLKGSVMVHY